MASPPALSTHNLGRDFGTLRALDDVSFDVAAGSIFGFLGPNGSGKTTMIRLLLGLLEPTAGRAEVLGFDTQRDGPAIRRRCGALLEHPGLYERLTAEDNLEFAGRAWRMPRAERRRRIEELLRGLGLWERRREGVGGWSRGMKQKLGIARALLPTPGVVFLDEPTAGLDPIAAASLREELRTLARSDGVTVFLTTHNLSEAEKLCDVVAVIRAGHLLTVGPPRELGARIHGHQVAIDATGLTPDVLARLRAEPWVRSVELRDTGLVAVLVDGAEASAVVALLVGAGVAVGGVRTDAADLEEAFISLVSADEGAAIESRAEASA